MGRARESNSKSKMIVGSHMSDSKGSQELDKYPPSIIRRQSFVNAYLFIFCVASLPLVLVLGVVLGLSGGATLLWLSGNLAATFGGFYSYAGSIRKCNTWGYKGVTLSVYGETI